MGAVLPGDNCRGTAIVTGASSGIGAAVARALARERYRTVLIARRAPLLSEVAAECERSAPSRAVAFDLSRTDEIAPLLTRVLAEEPAADGPVILVNNAGAGRYGPFLEHQSPDFERLIRLNYLAPIECIRAVLPRMLAEGRGHVFNIGSMSSVIGCYWHPAYGPTKAALCNLTEALASEHESSGVRFTLVLPGIIRTPYFDAPDMRLLWRSVSHRSISAEAMADAIVSAIGTRKLHLHMPRHYRALSILAACVPSFAARLVRANSRPLPSTSGPRRGAAPVAAGVPARDAAP
ncbi:MAG: SDR family NAD(P)-dependent oxidoreductase [Planctomycetota bacterium]|nr:SDR family NAD(P)-dependent oxidoreductase [Planctomycetota bacterium]